MDSHALPDCLRSGYNRNHSGRGSARIECAVRVREVGGSNPPAPTENQIPTRDSCKGVFSFNGAVVQVLKNEIKNPAADPPNISEESAPGSMPRWAR